MNIKWVGAALLAAAMASSASSGRAAGILIDDFASKPSSFYIIGTPTPPFYLNGKPVKDTELPTTIGGVRDTVVSVQGAPTPQSAQFLLGVDPVSFPTGVFHVATAGTPATIATLQYDGDDTAETSSTNAQLLDVSIPANGSFAIDFISIDSPGSDAGLKIDIQLTSIGGGTATFSDYAPETSIAATFNAPLASFLKSPEFDPAHISSLTFVFNQAGLADADFTVDNLRAVPEPNALVLAGLGFITALGVRRRLRA